MDVVNKSVTVSSFDPKSPASLIVSLCSSPSSPSFSSLQSDDGLGCNAEEIQCLMRLIEVHNDHYQSNNPSRHHMGNSSKALSKAYRSHIVECIKQLEQRLSESTDTDAMTTIIKNDSEVSGTKADQERKDKELLKLNHAITHLAEIFLSDGCMDEQGRFSRNNDIDFSFQLTTAAMPRKAQNQMGTVTADTIRYLRYHHIGDIDDYINRICGGGDFSIQDLLDSNQPEHWLPNNQQVPLYTSNLTPFWELVRKLVKRGLMKDAAYVLSKHSACVRATEKFLSIQTSGGGSKRSSFIDQTIREDIEAFDLIEKLLLFAPIPGGRTELNDNGLGDNQSDDDENMEGGEAENDDEDWWNGLSVDAFKLWDTYHTEWNHQEKKKQGAPQDFNINYIMNVYKSWKLQITTLLNSNIALRNVTQRIPNLKTCIWDVITNTNESFSDSDDWAERLVAELLYVRPNIRKEDVAVRAGIHMKACGIDLNDSNSHQLFEHIVLEVMKGNAGTVIESLHSFGGGSGAALPATMTALLCSLLVENGQIKLSDLSYDIQTEKLLSASSAILSSFTVEHHNEIGMRLSTKLLQPHITPENLQITAHVAAILNRHWPKTDAEARALLEICTDPIERGSFRILDACESLCFARFLFYTQGRKLDQSVDWLLRGIHCATKLGSEERGNGIRTDVSRSMCYRHLTKLCVNMTSEILKMSSRFRITATNLNPELLQVIKTVKAVQDNIVEDELSDLILADPSVALFNHVANISRNLLESNNKAVAKDIIMCLEEQKDIDGSMVTLSYPGLYGLLLSLAFDILNVEDQSFGGITEAAVSFDVYGLQVLLCCFHHYSNAENYDDQLTYNLRDDISMEKMRFALGKGLMRAFVAQNALLGKEGKSDVDDVNDDSSLNMDQLLGASM